jgi:hypothetical protein
MGHEKVNSEGEQLRFPPSDGRLTPSWLPASPSRAGHQPPPCDQGAIPPWIPHLICFTVASHGVYGKSVNLLVADIYCILPFGYP